MSMIAQIAFWVSAVAVAATYIVYPVSIALIGASRRRHTKPDQPPEITPSVSVVVSAYNEAKVIREKINNLLALDYPAEKLQVLIISDASDDGTDGIVRSLEDPRVLLCRQETRRGKSSGLTRFVPRASGEILVFSDANSMYHPMAVRRLVRHFSDPSVGYVVGEQRYAENGLTVAQSEATYERYEALIKEHESRVGSVVGGDGAIYAIRANLFRPLRADDISDLVNPLQIVVQGYRGVFEREAFCYENAAADYRGEFRRKARIVNRSLLGVMRHAQALNPARVGWFAYQLLLHKVVRWLVPFILLLA
jgi:cellulose synthase/poly-beta-1,6-N-acetylglucosamine synthase-like glycosyltransferase